MAQYVPSQKAMSRGQFSMSPRMKASLISDNQEGSGLSGFTVLANLVATSSPVSITPTTKATTTTATNKQAQPNVTSSSSSLMRITFSHSPPDTQFLDLDLARFAQFQSECFQNHQLSCRHWTKPCHNTMNSVFFATAGNDVSSSASAKVNSIIVHSNTNHTSHQHDEMLPATTIEREAVNAEQHSSELALYLVGLFDIHQQVRNSPLECGPIDKSASTSTRRSMQNMEAFLWAIDYVNENANLLPGIRLDSFIIDTCSSFLRTNQVIANLIREQHKQQQSSKSDRNASFESGAAARMLPSEARIMAFVADNHNDEAVEAIVSMASANRLLTFVTQAKSTKLTELVSGKQVMSTLNSDGSPLTTGDNLVPEDGSLVSVPLPLPLTQQKQQQQQQQQARQQSTDGSDSLFRLDFDSLESALSGGANLQTGGLANELTGAANQQQRAGSGVRSFNIVGQPDLLHKQEQLMVRMAVPNDVIAESIVSVLVKMQWNYVSLVYENEPDLQDLHDELIRRLFMREIQLATDEKIAHKSGGGGGEMLTVNFTAHSHAHQYNNQVIKSQATLIRTGQEQRTTSKYQQQQAQLSLMYESILARLLQKSMSGARVVIVLLSQEKTRNLLETLRHFRKENLMPTNSARTGAGSETIRSGMKETTSQAGQQQYLLNVMQWITVTDREPFYSFAQESLGTLALSRSMSLLPEFKQYYDTLTPNNNTRNPWWREYMESIGGECQTTQSQQPNNNNRRLNQLQQQQANDATGKCQLASHASLASWAPQLPSSINNKYLASGWEHNGADVINAVFAFANGLEVVRKELCPKTARGMCKQMVKLLEAQPDNMLRASSGSSSSSPAQQQQQVSLHLTTTPEDANDAADTDTEAEQQPTTSAATTVDSKSAKLISEMIHEQLQRSTFQMADGRLFDLNSVGNYVEDKLKLYNLRYLQSNSIGFVKVGFYDQQEGLYLNLSKARAYTHMSINGDIALDRIRSQCQDPTVCILDEASLASSPPIEADQISDADHHAISLPVSTATTSLHINHLAHKQPRQMRVSPSKMTLLDSPTNLSPASILFGDFSFEALMPLHRRLQFTSGGSSSFMDNTNTTTTATATAVHLCEELDTEHMFNNLVALIYGLEQVAARSNQEQTLINSQMLSVQTRHHQIKNKKVLVRLSANIYDYCNDVALAKEKIQHLIGDNSSSKQVAVIDYGDQIGAMLDEAATTTTTDKMRPNHNHLLHVTIGASAASGELAIKTRKQQTVDKHHQAAGSAGKLRNSTPEKRHELEAMIDVIKSVKQWRMIHLFYTDHHQYKDEFIELANQANICIAKLIWVPHAITKDNFDPLREFSFPEAEHLQKQKPEQVNAAGNNHQQQPVRAYDPLKQTITYLDGSSETLSSYIERNYQQQEIKLKSLFQEEFPATIINNSSNGTNGSTTTTTTTRQQTNLIVFLTSDNVATNLLIAKSLSGAMLNNYVWLTSHEWLNSLASWFHEPAQLANSMNLSLQQLIPKMMLSTKLESYNSEEFLNYLVSHSPHLHAPIPSHLFEEFWQRKFQCLLPKEPSTPMMSRRVDLDFNSACTGNEQLSPMDIILHDNVYHTIDIVESLSESLRQFIEQECPHSKLTVIKSLQECDSSPEAPTKLLKLMRQMGHSSQSTTSLGNHHNRSSSLSFNYHVVQRITSANAMDNTDSNSLMGQLGLVKVALWRRHPNRSLQLIKHDDGKAPTSGQLIMKATVKSQLFPQTDSSSYLLALGNRVWSRCLDQWSCEMCQKQIDETKTNIKLDKTIKVNDYNLVPTTVRISLLNEDQPSTMTTTTATSTSTTYTDNTLEEAGVSSDRQQRLADKQQQDQLFDSSQLDSSINSDQLQQQTTADSNDIDDRLADSLDALASTSTGGQFRRSHNNNQRHHVQMQMMLRPPLTLNLGHISGVLLLLLSVCGVASVVISMAYLISMHNQQLAINTGAGDYATTTTTGYGTNANLYNYFLLAGLLMLYLINIGFLLPATMSVCWFRRIGLATAYTTIYSSFLLKIISIWRHSQLLKLTLFPKLLESYQQQQQQQQQQDDEKRSTLKSSPEARALGGNSISMRGNQSMRKYNSIVSNDDTHNMTRVVLDDCDIDDVRLTFETFVDPIDTTTSNNNNNNNNNNTSTMATINSQQTATVRQQQQQQQFYNISSQQQQQRDTQVTTATIGQQFGHSDHTMGSFKLRVLRLLSPATMVSSSICLILTQIIISLIWFIRQPPQPGYYQAAWRCASITRMPMLFKYEPLICLLYPFVLLFIAWLVSAFAYRCSKSSVKALNSKKNIMQIAIQVEHRQRFEQVESKLLLITSTIIILVWSLVTINMISSQSQAYPNNPAASFSSSLHNSMRHNVINNEPTITMLPPITAASSYYDLNIVSANLISAFVIYLLMFAYRIFFINRRLFIKSTGHQQQQSSQSQFYNSQYSNFYQAPTHGTAEYSSNHGNSSWWSFLFQFSGNNGAGGQNNHLKKLQQTNFANTNNNQMMMFNQNAPGLYSMRETPGPYNDLFTLVGRAGRGPQQQNTYRDTINNSNTHLATANQTNTGYGTTLQQGNTITSQSSHVLSSSHLAHIPNQPYQSTTLNPLSFRKQLAQVINSRRNSSAANNHQDTSLHDTASTNGNRRNRLSCNGTLNSNNNSRRSSSTCMTELNNENMGSVGSATSSQANGKKAKRSRTSLGQYFIGATSASNSNREHPTTKGANTKSTKKQQQDFNIEEARSVSRRPSTSAASTTSSTAKLMFDDLLIDDDDGTMSCASSVASSSTSQLHGNELYPIDCSIQFEANIGNQPTDTTTNTTVNNGGSSSSVNQQQLSNHPLRRSLRSRKSLNSTSLRGVVIAEESNVITNNSISDQSVNKVALNAYESNTSEANNTMDNISDDDFYEDDEYAMSFAQQNYIGQHFEKQQKEHDDCLRGSSETDFTPESVQANETNDLKKQSQQQSQPQVRSQKPPQKPKPRTTLIKQQKQHIDEHTKVDHVDVHIDDTLANESTSIGDEDKEKFHYKL